MKIKKGLLLYSYNIIHAALKKSFFQFYEKLIYIQQMYSSIEEAKGRSSVATTPEAEQVIQTFWVNYKN